MDHITYYKNYLNITNEQIVCSTQREIPLNKQYYYAIIGTLIDGEAFYSVSPKYYACFKKFINISEGSISDQLNAFNGVSHMNHTLRKMYRMCYKGQPLKVNKAVCLTEPMMRALLKDHKNEEIDAVIKRNRDEFQLNKKFVVIEDDQIASVAKISDIDHLGGNIAVYTNPKYRGKGYGKMVVDACVNWCNQHGVVPIYLVVTENTPSIKLAESLGFETFSTEWILSEERL